MNDADKGIGDTAVHKAKGNVLLPDCRALRRRVGRNSIHRYGCSEEWNQSKLYMTGQRFVIVLQEWVFCLNPLKLFKWTRL